MEKAKEEVPPGEPEPEVGGLQPEGGLLEVLPHGHLIHHSLPGLLPTERGLHGSLEANHSLASNSSL